MCSNGCHFGRNACACVNAFSCLALRSLQPILLSNMASVMDAWMDISGGTSGIADTNHRSSAVFFIKNDDAFRPIPPLAELRPPPSTMDAAKDILSNAVSRVSTWVIERQQAKANPLQTQELQVRDEPRRSDAKRVPRSQRLAKSAVRVDGAGTFRRSRFRTH